MIKRRKISSTFVLMFVIITMTVLMACATTEYLCPAKTFSLSSGCGWTTQTTTTKLSDVKETASPYFRLNTVSKTMWSFPSFRLVDSKNVAKSDVVPTQEAGVTMGFGSNYGEVGKTYYGSVKPAFNQLGTDTIKLRLGVE